MNRLNSKTISNLEESRIKMIQEYLISWYLQNHRKLPFRESKDPYPIWISEIMLQQTQVATVIDYYNRFIELFPTVTNLASGNDETVLKAWEGLGYYSRARNLHKAAKIIAEKYGGNFPDEYETILSLPGVGDYTAGAISSIAFGKAVPAIDGNVMRVFSRLFLIEEDISQTAVKKVFRELGFKMVSPKDPSSFNQGLMELGALICTPTSPKCPECPLRDLCLARNKNIQENLPVKKKKKPPQSFLMEAALVSQGDKILIVKRPPKGVLANFWALPIIEKVNGSKDGETIQKTMINEFRLNVSEPVYMLDKIHVFTHKRWHMKLYAMNVLTDCHEVGRQEKQWVTKQQLKEIALPAAFKKMLENI